MKKESEENPGFQGRRECIGFIFEYSNNKKY